MNKIRSIITISAILLFSTTFVFAQEIEGDAENTALPVEVEEEFKDQTEILENSEEEVIAEVKENKTQFGMEAEFTLAPAIILRPYLVQEVSAKVVFPNKISLQLGARAMELFFFKYSSDPYLSLAPFFEFGYDMFYFQGGPLFCIYDDFSGFDLSFFFSTGAKFGKWQWGKGQANMKIGIEFSPVSVSHSSSNSDSTEEAVGESIAGIFALVYSIPKIDIGLTYFLPF